MQKTDIEWCNYSINPVKGLCPVGCSYCYARRLYKRFHLYKDGTPNPTWDYKIRFDWSVANDLAKMKPGSKVFWGSTMELFGDWIAPELMRLIFEAVKRHSNLTHIFLTKRPENLIKWSPFPENCWVGVSVPRIWDDTTIGNFEAFQRISRLGEVKATVKFISFEPLQADIASAFDFGLDTTLKAYGIGWIIIGQVTPVSQKTAPEYSWIEDIVSAADKARIPVFIKDNLNACAIGDHPNLVDECGRLRQEFPLVSVG